MELDEDVEAGVLAGMLLEDVVFAVSLEDEVDEADEPVPNNPPTRPVATELMPESGSTRDFFSF